MKDLELSAIIRHLEHKSDLDESRRLWEWIGESEENRAGYYRMVELWALRSTKKFSAETEIEGAVRTFNAAVGSRSGNRRMKRLLAFTSSAAAVLAVALILIGASAVRQHFKWHSMATGADDRVQQFHLADGTKVFLNNSSEISFRNDFNSRSRHVKLRGEAYFEVVTDPLRPFTVSAEGLDVRVLGTSFNVRTGDRVETALEKGRVELQDRKGNMLTAMKPGQIACYDPLSGEIMVETANTARYTSWRFDQDVYESVSMREIVGVIEERFGVSVSLSNDLLDKSLYRLVIAADDSLREVMETLGYIASVDYAIGDNHVMIKSKKTSR